MIRPLKTRVSEILAEALAGTDGSRYRTEGGYVRWGRVEKDLHAAIDEARVTEEELYHLRDIILLLNGNEQQVIEGRRQAAALFQRVVEEL